MSVRLLTIPMRTPVAAAASIALLLALGGCGGGSDPRTTTPPTTSSPAESNPPAEDEGELTLSSDASVHYRCVGHGTPAVLLEAGTDSAGTDQFGSPFVTPLAETWRVCTYDRLGTGSSDQPPEAGVHL